MGTSRRGRVRRPSGEWWKSGSISTRKFSASSTRRVDSGKSRCGKQVNENVPSCLADTAPNGTTGFDDGSSQSISLLLPASKDSSYDDVEAVLPSGATDSAMREIVNTSPPSEPLVKDSFVIEQEFEDISESGGSEQATDYFPTSSDKIVQNSNSFIRNSRRNRGRGNSSIPLQRLDKDTLLSRADLILSANSKSTKANVKRARTILAKFASQHSAPDPNEVTPNSSVLVMNVIAYYCNFGNGDALKNDAMGSLIQGLRIVYEEHGHTTAWTLCEGRAYGNPLIENRDITKLRRAHRVNLAKHGVLTVRARPRTAAIVCDHAAKYWFKNNDEDVLLHAIFVLGLHLGLRYDEVSKLELEFLSVTSDAITLRTSLGVKNQTGQRSYKLEEWPGNTPLRGSLFMDPKVALLSWLTVRGTADGYVFCDVSTGNQGFCKINTSKALSAARFTAMMRKRLLTIGISSGDVAMYSAHSLKRGSVQLYRSLGLRDEYIMQKVQMVGPRAYATYCAAYNDCAPNDLPRFASAEEYIQHAARIMGERNLLLNDEAYANFMSEVVGSQEYPNQQVEA